MRGRVEQAIGPARVVGHQEQTFARLVETADRRHEGQVEIGKAVIDRAAPFGIVARGDQPARLVEHQIDLAFGNDPFTVDGDAVAVEIDPQRWVARDLARHAHAPFGHQQLGLLARTQPKL